MPARHLDTAWSTTADIAGGGDGVARQAGEVEAVTAVVGDLDQDAFAVSLALPPEAATRGFGSQRNG